MKIVNADWELKNIGKVTIEITLEKSDLDKPTQEIISSVIEAKENYKAEYTVLKIPAVNPMIGVEFTKYDFFHIETQLNLKATREDVKFSLDKYGYLFADAEIEFVTDLNGLKNIQNELLKGIFTKDRISLDPYFNAALANRRYANWIENEFNRGSQIFYVAVDGKSIGFSLWRYDKSSAFLILSGLFYEYRFSNLGGNIYFAAIEKALQNGAKKFYTSVSSNNLESLRLNESTGFRVHSLHEVYVSHKA